jgi:hypothetical protein
MEADISIWHKPGHFYFALTMGNFHKITKIVELSRPIQPGAERELSSHSLNEPTVRSQGLGAYRLDPGARIATISPISDGNHSQL